MSEEIKKELPAVVSSILANPRDEVPPDKLLELMQIWREKILSEIAEQEGKKGEVYKIYKRQKDMYDKWLSGPMGKMKKFDKVISGRKKVLIDIDKEINKIKDRLSPPTSNAQQ